MTGAHSAPQGPVARWRHRWSFALWWRVVRLEHRVARLELRVDRMLADIEDGAR